MRAVWSFWTKPYLVHRDKTWPSALHHLCSWALSFESVRRHYPKTTLVTDRAGASLLIERLGLGFDTVTLDLEELDDTDPGWWAAGKLLAYSRQREPFVHIDSDAYLWKPLPSELERAPVFAQNPERVLIGRSCYNPLALENALAGVEGAWLPEEWTWYREQGLSQYASCCGIFGGNNLEFIQRYASTALQLIDHPANRRALESFPDKIGQTILIEQYFLAACCAFYSVPASNLFRSAGAAYDPRESEAKGFTHLVAGAKNDPAVAARLEARVKADFPEIYDRCLLAS